MVRNTIKIDGVTCLVLYATPKYVRPSRVNVSENLAKGKPVFQIPGLSQIRKASLEILIPQTNETFLKTLDTKVYNNERITIISTFKNIPSGDYYITNDFQVEYHNRDYLKVPLELILFNGEEVTEFVGKSNKLSTSKALNTDKGSVKAQTQKYKVIKEGESDKALVKKIQKALRRAGYYKTAGKSTLKIDGVYGKYTTQAVRQFQKANGLKVTGTITKETADKLKL